VIVSIKTRPIRYLKDRINRWIIVHPEADNLAWSGMRWDRHYGGIGITAEVCNFETEVEAVEYALHHMLAGIGNHNREVRVEKED
jgi:hypothetical protein